MVSVTDRWAGCGRSTAAWSLLSRPFWWKAGINLQCWCMTLAHCHDPSQQNCHLFSLVHIGCQNKCRCILQSVFQATTSSCMSRIMADIWGERAPKGLSEDLDAWQYWQCPLRVGQGLSTRAVMISCGAPRTCVLASWILWLAATERWKACAPRLAAAWLVLWHVCTLDPIGGSGLPQCHAAQKCFGCWFCSCFTLLGMDVSFRRVKPLASVMQCDLSRTYLLYPVVPLRQQFHERCPCWFAISGQFGEGHVAIATPAGSDPGNPWDLWGSARANFW